MPEAKEKKLKPGDLVQCKSDWGQVRYIVLDKKAVLQLAETLRDNAKEGDNIVAMVCLDGPPVMVTTKRDIDDGFVLLNREE